MIFRQLIASYCDIQIKLYRTVLARGTLTKASAGSILLQAATEMSSRDANSKGKAGEDNACQEL